MSQGILLYAMVWGSFPFYTEDEIRFDEVNLDFGITPECKDIIRKCLKKCPNERPSLLQLFDTPFIKQTKLNEGSEDMANFPVPGTSASSNSFSASDLTHSEHLNNASPNSFIVSNLEGEDLTNASNPETSVSPNSLGASNLSSEYLINASNAGTLAAPNYFSDSNLSSEDLTNASNSGTSATPNSFSDSNLSREKLTNASNPETSVSTDSFSASDLTGSEDLTNASHPGTLATPNSFRDSDLTNASKTSATPNSLGDSVEDKLIETKITLGEKRKCETTQIQTDFELDVSTETSIKRKKQGFFKSFENQTDAVEAAFMFHEKESRKGQKNTKKEKKRSRSR